MMVVLGFYVSPTAKVIRRRDLGLKYHPKDWGNQVTQGYLGNLEYAQVNNLIY